VEDLEEEEDEDGEEDKEENEEDMTNLSGKRSHAPERVGFGCRSREVVTRNSGVPLFIAFEGGGK